MAALGEGKALPQGQAYCQHDDCGHAATATSSEWVWSPVDAGASTTTVPVVLTARALLLDGTIVNSEAVIERCWRGWAVSHGLDPQQALKVVYGRLSHASMVVLLLDRPMEVNHVEMFAP